MATTNSIEKPKFEFGGPAGNVILMIGLPLTVYYLYFSVRFNGGALLPGAFISYAPFGSFLESIVPAPGAWAVFLGWFAFQAALAALLPGRMHTGVKLPDGSALSYRMNGPAAFLVSIATAAVLVWFDIVDPAIVYDNFGGIISAGIIFVYAFAAFLYFFGKKTGSDNPSGSIIQDFFLGTSLNPRIPPKTGFDLKFFCEARPGLIGWMMINFSFMAVQYRTHGEITLAMAVTVAIQFLYVADYYLHEPAILTTVDIVHDRFGWMLAFGDLVWVPLTYSLQAFYLIGHPHALPVMAAAGIILLNMAGYYIFRATNLQKHRFRTRPGQRIWGHEPRFIQTSHGNRILVSGFWGLARHFNYVGDIMMALAWCLPCLFDSPIPYFYVIYFTALLVHRERRDDRKCSLKYGTDWDEYKKLVPWRIVPRIY